MKQIIYKEEDTKTFEKLNGIFHDNFERIEVLNGEIYGLFNKNNNTQIPDIIIENNNSKIEIILKK